MSRNVGFYNATEGRDKGKRFMITEMSAFDIEAWAFRALLAVMKANPNVPEDFLSLGAAAMVQIGFGALQQLDWADAKPLMDEMITCVSICPDRSKPNFSRPLNKDVDVEEVPTIKDLRVEWWTLHMGFLQSAVPSLVSRVKGKVAQQEKDKPKSRTRTVQS